LSVLDADRGAHGQRLPAGHVQLHRGAVDRFGEGQGRARLDVAALDRWRIPAAESAAESAEQIRQVRGHVSPAAVGGAGPRPSAASEEVGEHVLESAAGSTAGSPRTGAEAGSAAHGANLIVLGAGLLVGQHLMRLADLLELLFGLLITGVGVRVVLARELAVGLLDLGVGSIFGDAEGLIEILLEPIILRTGIHLAPPSFPTILSSTYSLVSSQSASPGKVPRRSGPPPRRSPGPVRQFADARARGRLGDGGRSVLRLLDSDPGRADDALPDSIARLHDQEDRRILDIVRRLLHERFVDVRFELVPALSVLLDAELRQRVDELVHMGLERPGDIAVLTGELDLVEHGDQGFNDLDRAAEGRTLTFAVGTHPVCRVFGIDALEIREVSRGLRARFGLFGLLGFGPVRGRLGVGLGTDLTGVRIDPALVAESEAWLLGRLVVALGSHYFFSSSSSSTTSASTTSSSAPALESAPASSPAAAPSAPCWL